MEENDESVLRTNLYELENEYYTYLAFLVLEVRNLFTGAGGE